MKSSGFSTKEYRSRFISELSWYFSDLCFSSTAATSDIILSNCNNSKISNTNSPFSSFCSPSNLSMKFHSFRGPYPFPCSTSFKTSKSSSRSSASNLFANSHICSDIDRTCFFLSLSLPVKYYFSSFFSKLILDPISMSLRRSSKHKYSLSCWGLWLCECGL